MSYVDRVIEQVKAKDSEQPEFIQACLLYTSRCV